MERAHSSAKSLCKTASTCDCTVEAELRASLKRAEKQLALLKADLPEARDYLDRALYLALEFTGSQAGFIALYDDVQQKLTIETRSFGMEKNNPLRHHPRVFAVNKANIWTEVVYHQHPVLMNGLTWLPSAATTQNTPASTTIEKTHSSPAHPMIHNLLAVPVFDKKRLSAVLLVVNKMLPAAPAPAAPAPAALAPAAPAPAAPAPAAAAPAAPAPAAAAPAALAPAAPAPAAPAPAPAAPADYDDGDVTALDLLMNNVWSLVERKRSDEQLRHEKELFKTTLLSIGDGIIATDAQGRITIMNDIAQRLTGWGRADALGRPFDDAFRIIDERTRQRCDSPVEQILTTRRPTTLANRTILITRDGREVPIGDSASPIFDHNGEVKGAVIAFRDATEEVQRLNRIEYLSFHDELTGLYNRHFFEEELARVNTRRNLPISLIIGDVNGLKLTNDAFGHVLGDQLLKKAAAVLKSCCREDDIIARIGGDEFVILLPKTTSAEAEQVVRRINEACRTARAGTVPLSISFGWETKSTPNQSIDEVRKKAENWMYRRKLFDSPSNRSRTIEAITQTLFETHHNEERHAVTVSALCERMGQSLNMSEREIQELRTTAFLHDIGKIAIDSHVINKPGPLDDQEWHEVRRHSEIGYRILSATDTYSDLASHVLAHHERWDGAGYPRGLQGEQIPLIARIITIADAFEAMISPRPYRAARGHEDAFAEILAHAGTQFDPTLARHFVTCTMNANSATSTEPAAPTASPEVAS